jgi:hypothetical protein
MAFKAGKDVYCENPPGNVVLKTGRHLYRDSEASRFIDDANRYLTPVYRSP